MAEGLCLHMAYNALVAATLSWTFEGREAGEMAVNIMYKRYPHAWPCAYYRTVAITRSARHDSVDLHPVARQRNSTPPPGQVTTTIRGALNDIQNSLALPILLNT